MCVRRAERRCTRVHLQSLLHAQLLGCCGGQCGDERCMLVQPQAEHDLQAEACIMWVGVSVDARFKRAPVPWAQRRAAQVGDQGHGLQKPRHPLLRMLRSPCTRGGRVQAPHRGVRLRAPTPGSTPGAGPRLDVLCQALQRAVDAGCRALHDVNV